MKRSLWLFLVSVSHIANASFTDSFSGVWTGQGKQDSGSEWAIQITAEKGSYEIEYPSLNCGGKLLLLSENSGSATFREELEYGLNACVNLGKVELYTMEANLLKFIWYYSNGNIDAYGEVSCDSCQIGTPIVSSGDADFEAGKVAGIQQCVDAPGSCGIAISGAHAIYEPNSGEVRIPFIDVPDAFGGVNIYEIYLLQQPGTFTFDLDMNRINPQ